MSSGISAGGVTWDVIYDQKKPLLYKILLTDLCEQHASLACVLAPQMLLHLVCFSRSTSQKVCAHSWKATLGDITHSFCYLSQVSDSRSSFHPCGSLAFIAFQSRGSHNKGSGYEAEKYARLRGRLTMLFSGDLWPSLGN